MLVSISPAEGDLGGPHSNPGWSIVAPIAAPPPISPGTYGPAAKAIGGPALPIVTALAATMRADGLMVRVVDLRLGPRHRLCDKSQP